MPKTWREQASHVQFISKTLQIGRQSREVNESKNLAPAPQLVIRKPLSLLAHFLILKSFSGLLIGRWGWQTGCKSSQNAQGPDDGWRHI